MVVAQVLSTFHTAGTCTIALEMVLKERKQYIFEIIGLNVSLYMQHEQTSAYGGTIMILPEMVKKRRQYTFHFSRMYMSC